MGKSDSTISKILTLNRLPDGIKDDCRNDPKAMRSILILIARQKTAEQMTALYTKYKESFLTVGEVRKKTAPKAIKKPLTADDVTAWEEKLDTIVIADMTAEQKTAMLLEVEKLRSVTYQKIKLLKV